MLYLDFNCEFCESVQSSKSNLLRHRKSHGFKFDGKGFQVLDLPKVLKTVATFEPNVFDISLEPKRNILDYFSADSESNSEISLNSDNSESDYSDYPNSDSSSEDEDFGEMEAIEVIDVDGGDKAEEDTPLIVSPAKSSFSPPSVVPKIE